MSKITALTPLIVALAAGIAAGADDPGGRGVSHTITIVDSDLIHPSTLTIRSGDALEFENYSAETMVLLLTEPDDPSDKIRCRLIDADAAAPGARAWRLDDFRPEPKLSAVVPPGKSESLCSLTPGRYAFEMRQVSRDVRAPGATLGPKGTITVVR